jgi:TetR/AcrR family tetracycline transcriptional repressor
VFHRVVGSPVIAAAPASARLSLDRETIVSAALDLLDEAGLDALSTRRLARRLGVRGPSLYWHVRSMAELHDLMADQLLVQALPSTDAADDWRTWLADGARAYRRAALSRRDAARLLAMARPTEARRRDRFAPNIARLQASGFSPDDAWRAFVVLARYAMGFALAEQTGRGPSDNSAATFELGLDAMIDGLDRRRLAPLDR